MKHGSLFNGIGGFQLAAEWMGWENLMSCEIEKRLNELTKSYWPTCIQHEDIRNTDFTIYRGKIDILTGGFPCQPFSVAGNQLGTEDERHLWPEMLRAIREIAPRWVVGENVFGLVNWNGGLVFEQVQADLEAEGYEAQPYILPACAVNATHRRDRVWFVAYRNSEQRQQTTRGFQPQFNELSSENPDSNGRYGFIRKEESKVGRFRNISSGDNEQLSPNDGKAWITSDSSIQGQQERVKDSGWENDSEKSTGMDTQSERLSDKQTSTNTCNKRFQRSKKYGVTPGIGKNRNELFARLFPSDWQNFPTQSPVCSGNDGFSIELVRAHVEANSDGVLKRKEIDKIVRKTIKAIREESIKGYGNAIVPAVALQIFKAIEQYENL